MTNPFLHTLVVALAIGIFIASSAGFVRGTWLKRLAWSGTAVLSTWLAVVLLISLHVWSYFDGRCKNPGDPVYACTFLEHLVSPWGSGLLAFLILSVPCLAVGLLLGYGLGRWRS
jgi:hypothetical protein